MATPVFSAAVKALLSKSATEMTPETAIQKFETFLGDQHNARQTRFNNPVFNFNIPSEIKLSSNFTECMLAYKTNLEGCGFRENRTCTDSWKMEPAQFTFIKDAPHRCNVGCQYSGCPCDTLVCDYNDSSCHTLIVSL